MKFYVSKNGESNGDDAQPPEPNTEENHEAQIGDVSDEDVERLNDQLDELNSALDLLEQKNENIQARLKELLQSSRELRNDVNQDNVH
uniref:Unkown protein n=1 Tax=Riptortus pedestris TaxID=329032 RepID=R4WQ95_RIPPE|nr:unkown protein [Riptortus pedestris]